MTLRLELGSGIRLSQPSYCPPNIYNLMRSCWQDNPNSRPSFAQLKQSLYLDTNFPKNSKTTGMDEECDGVVDIYKNILEDATMRMRYNAICQQNQGYASLNCSKSDNETSKNAKSYTKLVPEAPTNRGNVNEKIKINNDFELSYTNSTYETLATELNSSKKLTQDTEPDNPIHQRGAERKLIHFNWCPTRSYKISKDNEPIKRDATRNTTNEKDKLQLSVPNKGPENNKSITSPLILNAKSHPISKCLRIVNVSNSTENMHNMHNIGDTNYCQGVNETTKLMRKSESDDNPIRETYKLKKSESDMSQNTQYTAIDLSETSSYTYWKYQQNDSTAIGRLLSVDEVDEC